MFADMLGILEAVSRLRENATKGMVQKMNIHLTVGQVGRLLTNLEKEGYLQSEMVAWGGTGKRIYAPTDRCHTNMLIVSSAIDAAMVPAEMAVAS